MEEAFRHLKALESAAEILPLYRHFFPQEYPRAVDFASPKDLQRHMNEFSLLVDTRLFPIIPFDWLDLDEDEVTPDWIPLQQHHSLWWERGVDDLTALEKVIITAANRHADSIGFKPLFTVKKDHDLDFALLTKLCGQGRYKFLPRAVRFVTGNTDNNYLDYDEECWYQSEMPNWTLNNMKWFTREWKEATKWRNDYASFEKFVLANRTRLQHVTTLLKRAIVPKQERVRVQSNSLVNILSGYEVEEEA